MWNWLKKYLPKTDFTMNSTMSFDVHYDIEKLADNR